MHLALKVDEIAMLERIKELCKARGISVGILESKLKLPDNTIYQWKSRTPSTERIEMVADYFNVSTDYLLGRTAFKKPMELFEHWSGHNDPYFESPFDFGGLLKEVREKQGVSQQEVSKALSITESDVGDIEDGLLPLNYEWAEKYANFLDTTVEQIFADNNMSVSLDDIPLELLRQYQKQGLSGTEMALAYAKFRKAETEDALREDKERYQSGPYKDIETIAAHHDGEDWTEDELKDIEEFKEFVRSRRKKKRGMMTIAI